MNKTYRVFENLTLMGQGPRCPGIFPTAGSRWCGARAAARGVATVAQPDSTRNAASCGPTAGTVTLSAAEVPVVPQAAHAATGPPQPRHVGQVQREVQHRGPGAGAVERLVQVLSRGGHVPHRHPGVPLLVMVMVMVSGPDGHRVSVGGELWHR